MANYISNAQQRIFRVMFCLSRNYYPGLKNGEVASYVGISAAQAVRDLANLEAAGIAKQFNGHWKLTPKITTIAVDLLKEINKMEQKLKELKRHTY